MKVLLLGLGLVGSNIFRMLISNEAVSELICCDKSSEKINAVKSSLKTIHYDDHVNVDFRKLDLSRDSDIENCIKGADVVVNSTSPTLNIKIMRGCLKVGADYLDLASNDYANAEQLSLNSEFVNEGLKAIINLGVSPGLTNLMAKWCSEVLDEVEVIKVRLVEDQIPYWRVWSWSPHLTIEHFSCPPIVYENGRFKIEKPLSGMEEYEFPNPIGRKRTYLIYGDELATLPKYIKLKRIDLKSGGSEIEFVKGLYDLGLFSNDEIRVDRKLISPIKVLYSLARKFDGYNPIEHIHGLDDMILAVSVEAIGFKGGERSILRINALPPKLSDLLNMKIATTPMAFSAAAVLVSSIGVIRELKEPGVYPPEALDQRLRGNIISKLIECYQIKILHEPIKIIKSTGSKSD
jgi:saccharopine dehydrogenase-like NADP-dependent oxidoreductase